MNKVNILKALKNTKNLLLKSSLKVIFMLEIIIE